MRYKKRQNKTTKLCIWWRRWDVLFHTFVMALTISWTWFPGPSAYYTKHRFIWNDQIDFRILVLPCCGSLWVDTRLLDCSTYRSALPYHLFRDLGFTDKAEFSLMCYHTRRLITNRTHVQKHRHLSVYERSRYIRGFANSYAYRQASEQLVWLVSSIIPRRRN